MRRRYLLSKSSLDAQPGVGVYLASRGYVSTTWRPGRDFVGVLTQRLRLMDGTHAYENAVEVETSLEWEAASTVPRTTWTNGRADPAMTPRGPLDLDALHELEARRVTSPRPASVEATFTSAVATFGLQRNVAAPAVGSVVYATDSSTVTTSPRPGDPAVGTLVAVQGDGNVIVQLGPTTTAAQVAEALQDIGVPSLLRSNALVAPTFAAMSVGFNESRHLIRSVTPVQFPVDPDTEPTSPEYVALHDRVVEVASTAARSVLGESVRIDPATGRLTEAEAQRIEHAVNQELRRHIVGDVRLSVDRESGTAGRLQTCLSGTAEGTYATGGVVEQWPILGGVDQEADEPRPVRFPILGRTQGTNRASGSISIPVATSAFTRALGGISDAVRDVAAGVAGFGSATSSFMRQAVEAVQTRESTFAAMQSIFPEQRRGVIPTPVFDTPATPGPEHFRSRWSNDFSGMSLTADNMARVIARMQEGSDPVSMQSQTASVRAALRSMEPTSAGFTVQGIIDTALAAIRENFADAPHDAEVRVTGWGLGRVLVTVQEQRFVSVVTRRLHEVTPVGTRVEVVVASAIQGRQVDLVVYDDLFDDPTAAQPAPTTPPSIVHVDGVEVAPTATRWLSRLVRYVGTDVDLTRGAEAHPELDELATEVEDSGHYLVYVAARRVLRVVTATELVEAGRDFRWF